VPDAGGVEETEAHDTEAAESMAQVVKKLLRRQAVAPAEDEGLWEPLNRPRLCSLAWSCWPRRWGV
jgi:hypothetical protein